MNIRVTTALHASEIYAPVEPPVIALHIRTASACVK